MKNYFYVLMALMCFPGMAYAQHIGPGVPAENLQGNIASPNLGVGYEFRQAEYDGVDIEEQRVYAHIGAVFGDESTQNYEVYVRLGGAVLEEDDGFESDTEPFFAAGIKSEFYQGEIFGWGGVLQAYYVDSYDDTIEVGGQEIDISLEENWGAELAFPLHARGNLGMVYLGPVFYTATTDVVSNDISQDEGDLDEDNNVGVFGGAALMFSNVSFEIESKCKSDLSVGGLVTIAF